MRKAVLSLSVLLATTSFATAAPPRLSHKGAVLASPVHANARHTLYDQSGDDSGIAIVSQNFESSFDAYDCQGADDFIVPDGVKWKITEVDVRGTYFGGSGPSRSLNIVFYKNKKGAPGKEVARSDEVVGGDDGNGSFRARLPHGPKLKPGHYWLSVQSNQDFGFAGEWGWETSSGVVNLPAKWRNPNDGFATGCNDWGDESTCVPVGGGDHLFALRGRDE